MYKKNVDPARNLEQSCVHFLFYLKESKQPSQISSWATEQLVFML